MSFWFSNHPSFQEYREYARGRGKLKLHETNVDLSIAPYILALVFRILSRSLSLRGWLHTK